MIRYFILLIAFMSLIWSATAQQTDLNFINFNSKNGLSSNTVNAILKDRYGYMWFATEDGLNKFDGVNFTVYRHQNNDSTSIGEGNVASLSEDQHGNLWIGAGNTLSMYNREKDAFINYVLEEGVIRSVWIDHSGDIWIGTYSGLFIMDRITKKVKKCSFNTDDTDLLMADAVICIFEDSRKRIWMSTNRGLYLTTANRQSFKRFVPVKNDPSSLPDLAIRAIVEDLRGNIWFGTKENGLSVMQPDGKSFKTFRHHENDDSTLSNDRIFALAIDAEGRIWTGTENGLDIFDPQSYKVSRISLDQRKKYSFTGKSVRSIYIDKDNIHWIGTFRAGINKYARDLAFFNHRQSNAYDPMGLSSSTVTSFAEGPNGDIYMGTDGGGLNLFHRKSGLFEHPQIDVHNKAQSILTMEMAGNELWIGTYPDGVYVRNSVNGTIRHYSKGNDKTDLCSNEIFCIRKDSRGNIWIGTNGNGLSMYDPASRTFDRFDPNDPKNSKAMIPSNGFIRGITEDRFGNIWFASNGSGIAVYDPARNSFKHLTPANSNLAYDFVNCLYTAKDGTVWAGTGGKGLCRFDYNSNRFTSYADKEGLANGFVYKILEDDAGKLWVSTNKGISSFDTKDGKFKNYTYHSGLQQVSYCSGAGIRTAAGEMYFGGLDGFNYFNPKLFHSNRNIPSLVFTDLKLANRSVVPGEKSVIKKHISIADEIRLKYKQNFSIDFVALNYTAPQESRYSYKLEGFDISWIDAGSSKTAVYANLAPGKYTFRLKARSEEGSWSTPETTIDIYVKSPFWLTSYAYIIYILLAGLIIWAIRYRAIKRVKNRYVLEKEREKFNQMLEDERREAERKREFDQVKIEFLTNLSHEFRTPISLIVSPAEQLLEGESNENRRQQLGLIKRNARRLLNLVNQLLDFRKLEASELKLNPTESDLVLFVKEVADSFQDISQRRGIDFSFSTCLSQYHTAFDRDKMERILFNLLSNAFKFTKENGKIGLNIERGSNDGVRILVADTGIGMDADTREKIFNRFFQGDSTAAILNQGSGIGLSIVREFVKMQGGTIGVESITGKGTSFIVELPLREIDKPIEQLPIDEKHRDNAMPVLTDNEEPAESQKPVILLIDDHEDFLNYLSANLRSQYKIIEASDGKQGWQKILSSHPQVIVSDINMPVMDGITLCRKIRSDKRTRHIPIILLTALTGDANQLKGLDTGANDYLTKPFNFEILNLRIRNLLNLNQELKTAYRRQIKVANPDVAVESEDEKLLRSVIRYIEANLDSPDLSVEELGKQVGMGRSSLYNKIVSLTGETPAEFIRSVKLDIAASLLENSDMRVSEIGYSVGFTTPSHFAQAFKAKFNLSPSQYAKLKRKSD